ncbi:receptor-interacting serine/threonine-protein kinase 3-like isoform X2 [Esox lucius]|uniref:receptor-interacting serine/threonine-protein kinase 3-like isoform X2 n=1 Tax=Esox lucius TaxID=8010 RepID=UPI0014778478|nr:receptor-interacting serine/threonine-protein kinase 3-like isoform X2 [Esox lucius]
MVCTLKQIRINSMQWLEPIQEEEEEEAKELVEVVDEEEKDTNKKKENEEQEDRYCLKVQRASKQYTSLDQSSAAQVKNDNLSAPHPTIPLPLKQRAELDEEEDGPQLETEVMNKRGKETSNRWSRPCWPVSDEVLPTPQEPQQREGGGMLPPPQKKISSRGKRKLPTADGMFPKWLMNLMHNIEEATTHELIVE